MLEDARQIVEHTWGAALKRRISSFGVKNKVSLQFLNAIRDAEWDFLRVVPHERMNR